MRGRRLLGAAIALVGAGAALSSAASGRPAAAAVKVTMTEFKFGLSARSVPRGPVLFRVTNSGETEHDFKISGKKTPIYGPGKGGSLRVTFKKAGRYAYICTVPGHADAGMKGVLGVK
jgi:plastocyanin